MTKWMLRRDRGWTSRERHVLMNAIKSSVNQIALIRLSQQQQVSVLRYTIYRYTYIQVLCTLFPSPLTVVLLQSILSNSPATLTIFIFLSLTLTASSYLSRLFTHKFCLICESELKNQQNDFKLFKNITDLGIVLIYT